MKDSSPRIPIVFIISPGVNPTSTIEKLAKEVRRHIVVVPMGQGQVCLTENKSIFVRL